MTDEEWEHVDELPDGAFPTENEGETAIREPVPTSL